MVLDVLVVFRDGHYSQETMAPYVKVGTVNIRAIPLVVVSISVWYGSGDLWVTQC
jgi:hypothetical protein